jgi:hypothetical protein
LELQLLTHEAIATRSVESLDELEAITSHRCWVLLERLFGRLWSMLSWRAAVEQNLAPVQKKTITYL